MWKCGKHKHARMLIKTHKVQRAYLCGSIGGDGHRGRGVWGTYGDWWFLILSVQRNHPGALLKGRSWSHGSRTGAEISDELPGMLLLLVHAFEEQACWINGTGCLASVLSFRACRARAANATSVQPRAWYCARQQDTKTGQRCRLWTSWAVGLEEEISTKHNSNREC